MKSFFLHKLSIGRGPRRERGDTSNFGATSRGRLDSDMPKGPPPSHSVHLSHHPSYPKRSPVAVVDWSDSYPEYSPVEFTHPTVFANDRTLVEHGWADPAKWTPELEEEVSMRSSTSLSPTGKVVMVDGRPRNPMGRTGMIGRGLLGKWGPNYAADPVVTRFHPKTGDLQMVAIKRKDTGDWAIPGGMVDASETFNQTLKREFIEEARNLERGEEQEGIVEKVELLFSHGGGVSYVGYVDDPRNTDNSWMETICVHFHISDPVLAASMLLREGDDAAKAKWLTVDDSEPDFKSLYVNHRQMVVKALKSDPVLFAKALLKVST